jgi:putative flippase GtrA
VNTLVRWGKFNLVGAIGMATQLGALAALNALWPGHYLVDTVAALELTLLHNFAWHVHYTWCDRLPIRDVTLPVRGSPGTKSRTGQPDHCGLPARQFMRFHLSNGLVSMVGNLALMPLLVRGIRLPVVAANAIAILCCSLVNFCLGDNWTFKRTGSAEV